MNLDHEFWNSRYVSGQTGWDIGQVSTPLKAYFDQLENKNISILIPGAGNAYEAEYLHGLGFTDVTVLDIAPAVIQAFKMRIPEFPGDKLVLGDFFKHDGQYDLIVEQTFFCALEPSLRPKYVLKMKALLKPQGKLAGVLFGIPLNQDQPPFGGNEAEYRQLFSNSLGLKLMERCYNSIPPRAGNELFFIAVN